MLRTTSPEAPPTTGVEIPTVSFLAAFASPWRLTDTVSIPSADVDVTLLVNSVGPSNLDSVSRSAPPDTFTQSAYVASTESSPVTVGSGASKISSSPVVPLITLLPTKYSPTSFKPV